MRYWIAIEDIERAKKVVEAREKVQKPRKHRKKKKNEVGKNRCWELNREMDMALFYDRDR